MGLRWSKLLILLIPIIFFECAVAAASWQGPQTVLSGGWGNKPDQFGYEPGDTGDIFPNNVIVLANADIWIPDSWVNERLKLYDNEGNLKKIVSLDKATRTFPEYWFIGQFIAIGLDGTVYMSDYMGKNLYARYSPTGQLIETSASRPLGLGVVKTESRGPSNYRITITYSDKTYIVSSDSYFEQYVRDNNGYMYGLNSGGVWKFNQCGKQVAELILPTGEEEVIAATNAPDQSVAFDVQYGQPIVSLSGDVYAWKKSPNKYSVVKWTWVDDSNVPSGPDAPTGLTVTPSTSGLFLTWTASPQDPGCVTGYEISRSTSAGGSGTTVGTTTLGKVTFNDSTAVSGTTYYYKVRAAAGTEFSPFTSEVSGRRP